MKLTSPNLNYVIILGAILLMVGTVFVPSPSSNLTLTAIFCPVSIITTRSTYVYVCRLISLPLFPSNQPLLLDFKNFIECWIWHLLCCSSCEDNKSSLHILEWFTIKKGSHYICRSLKLKPTILHLPMTYVDQSYCQGYIFHIAISIDIALRSS